MTPHRLFAVVLIFACTTVGWFVLGTSLVVRTGEQDGSLAREVEQLWGGRHLQLAPAAQMERPRTTTQLVTEKDAAGNPVTKEVMQSGTELVPLSLASSRLTVALSLDQRRKGLLWYDTYTVRFDGDYRLRNPDDAERQVRVAFAFPSKEGLYDGFDFPAGSISPTRVAGIPGRSAGRQLTWRFDSLVTGQKIGMDPPNHLNPGPLASRITFFAPVSLLFFLTVMVILGMVSGKNLHPMNYFFLAGAFFAFHLLLAYLVDHINIHAAFVIAALTSVGLVVSYLRVVTGASDTLAPAAAAQAIFLVLFSYAFFFEGYTGLAVTVGAVVTLFVLMQSTARVDWNGIFSRQAVRT